MMPGLIAALALGANAGDVRSPADLNDNTDQPRVVWRVRPDVIEEAAFSVDGAQVMLLRDRAIEVRSNVDLQLTERIELDWSQYHGGLLAGPAGLVAWRENQRYRLHLSGKPKDSDRFLELACHLPIPIFSPSGNALLVIFIKDEFGNCESGEQTLLRVYDYPAMNIIHEEIIGNSAPLTNVTWLPSGSIFVAFQLGSLNYRWVSVTKTGVTTINRRIAPSVVKRGATPAWGLHLSKSYPRLPPIERDTNIYHAEALDDHRIVVCSHLTDVDWGPAGFETVLNPENGKLAVGKPGDICQRGNDWIGWQEAAGLTPTYRINSGRQRIHPPNSDGGRDLAVSQYRIAWVRPRPDKRRHVKQATAEPADDEVVALELEPARLHHWDMYRQEGPVILGNNENHEGISRIDASTGIASATTFALGLTESRELWRNVQPEGYSVFATREHEALLFTGTRGITATLPDAGIRLAALARLPLLRSEGGFEAGTPFALNREGGRIAIRRIRPAPETAWELRLVSLEAKPQPDVIAKETGESGWPLCGTFSPRTGEFAWIGADLAPRIITTSANPLITAGAPAWKQPDDPSGQCTGIFFSMDGLTLAGLFSDRIYYWPVMGSPENRHWGEGHVFVLRDSSGQAGTTSPRRNQFTRLIDFDPDGLWFLTGNEAGTELEVRTLSDGNLHARISTSISYPFMMSSEGSALLINDSLGRGVIVSDRFDALFRYHIE